MKTDDRSSSALGSSRATRNRNIKLALMTSVFARMSGVLLQVFSLPIAAMKLGPSGFSIYSMLGALLGAMTLSNFGVSQATTLQMSRALGAGDEETAKEVLAVSLVMVGGISLLVSALMVTLVIFSPLLSVLFSRHLENSPEPIAGALFVCFVFLTTQLISVLEAAQLAQQRQHRMNIASSVGTLVAAGSVWCVTTSAPSVAGILLALHLPLIMARAINVALVWADVRPCRQHVSIGMRHARSVMSSGLHFVSGATIANFLCHPFSVLAVGAYAAPLASASYSAVMNAIILASSVLALIVAPFRGALPEAYARGDHIWVRNAMNRIFGVNLAYGLLIAIVLGGFGSWVFDLWYGGAVAPGQLELLGAGIYFVVLAAEVTNFTYLSSVGRLSDAARWLLIKSIFTALGIFSASALGEVRLVFWILTAVNLVFSLVPLGLIALKTKQIDSRTRHA